MLQAGRQASSADCKSASYRGATMELVNERQTYPLLLSGLLCLFLISLSYLFLSLNDPGQDAVNKYYWYMTRSAGFTSYELLALSSILGVSTTSSMWDRLKMRPVFTQVHQYVSLMIVPFLVVHLWGLKLDQSVPFTVYQLFVPFAANYSPFGTGIGILSLYLLVILVSSSILRRYIGVKAWRKIHYVSFALYVLVTLHGLVAGTDANQGWAVLLYLVPTVILILVVARRIQISSHKRNQSFD